MKRFLVTILALIYLTTSSGAILHLHYCMGKLVSWGLWDKNEDTCSKCGMTKEKTLAKGCCKDEHQYLKNATDQKATDAALQIIQVAAVVLPASFFELPTADFPSVTEENPISNAPPRSSGVAVYIRNCLFLI